MPLEAPLLLQTQPNGLWLAGLRLNRLLRLFRLWSWLLQLEEENLVASFRPLLMRFSTLAVILLHAVACAWHSLACNAALCRAEATWYTSLQAASQTSLKETQ